MAILEGYECKEGTIALVRAIVDGCSQQSLLDLAKTSPRNFAGFRTTPGTSPAPIRSRIVSLVQGNAPLDASLVRFLAEHDRVSQLLSSLSTEFINVNTVHLENAFGYGAVRLARMLDGRPEVRGKASKEETADEPKSAVSREESLKILGETLSPLAAIVKPSAVGGDPAEVKELRGELRKLKGAEKARDEAERKLAQAEQALAIANDRTAHAERERGEERQRAEKAEAQLARLTENAERSTAAIVQRKLAEGFASWLGEGRLALLRDVFPSELAPSATDSPSGGDFDKLVAIATAALEKQARADFVSGSRAVVEARLAQVEKLLAKASSAYAAAFHPEKDLAAAINALKSEADRLRSLLGKSEVSPAAAQLLAYVNTCDDREKRNVSSILGVLARCGVVTQDEARMVAAAITKGLGADATPFLSGDHATVADCVREGLAGRRALILLVDAHNALFKLQSRYRPPKYHGAWPDATARDALLADVASIFSQAPNCRAIVIFDGSERTDSDYAHNVKCIYSGGEGEHRADNALVDELKFLKQAAAAEYTVLVTEDKELSERAKKQGAEIMHPGMLMELFRGV